MPSRFAFAIFYTPVSWCLCHARSFVCGGYNGHTNGYSCCVVSRNRWMRLLKATNSMDDEHQLMVRDALRRMCGIA